VAEQDRVVIRVATPGDADAIAAITRTAFQQFEQRVYPPFQAHSQTPAHVRYEIETEKFVYGLAVVNDHIAGHVRYRLRPGYMHVSRLAVLPEFRGHGVGRRLMAWVEDEARRLRVQVLRGEVRTVLKDVLQYYLDIGYRVVGYASLRGVRRCLTLIEKRLPERPSATGAQQGAQLKRGKSSPDESAWVDESRLAPRLLHPLLVQLVEAAQRSNSERR